MSSWCCGGSIPSGVQDGSRSRSSRIQSRACNGNTGDGVPEDIQSQMEELSLRRVSRTQKTSKDLDLALGLRCTGHWVCLLLFAEGVVCEQEVFRNVSQEQGHLGIWPATLNWWVPWTVRLRRRKRGLWDSGLKAWVPLPSRPWAEQGSDDTVGRRTCPPALHSVQLLLRPECWKWTDTWGLYFSE